MLVIAYWLEKSGVAAMRVTCAVPEPVRPVAPAPEIITPAAGVKVVFVLIVNAPLMTRLVVLPVVPMFKP